MEKALRLVTQVAVVWLSSNASVAQVTARNSSSTFSTGAPTATGDPATMVTGSNLPATRRNRQSDPAVVPRKTWGGNRTHNGAQAQQILASILRTCWQQGKDSFSALTKLMRSP